jgi:hypothetical protein
MTGSRQRQATIKRGTTEESSNEGEKNEGVCLEIRGVSDDALRFE